MGYQPLEKIFHKDPTPERFSENKRIAEKRREAESTFRTGIVTEAGELFLAVPRELSLLNEKILRIERLVSQKMRQLPPIALGALIRGLVIDEVVSTNELEGVRSTRKQINDLLEEVGREGDELGPRQVKRFKGLANLYLGLSEPNPRIPESPEDIREIYDRVMSGEKLGRNKPDGDLFRGGPVEVIGIGGRVIHENTLTEPQIIGAIQQMIDLAGSEDIPETHSAIMAHYVFEYIHPFYDGNGRTGRYLLALYLSSPLSTLTVLSLSRMIAADRTAYYASFKLAESKLNHGELTFFVMSMLETIRAAQDDLIGELDAKRAQLETADECLGALEEERGLGRHEAGMLFMLAQHGLFAAFPSVALAEVAGYLGLHKQQTRKYARRLEEAGLIEATNTRPVRFMLTSAARKALGIEWEDGGAS